MKVRRLTVSRNFGKERDMENNGTDLEAEYRESCGIDSEAEYMASCG